MLEEGRGMWFGEGINQAISCAATLSPKYQTGWIVNEVVKIYTAIIRHDAISAISAFPGNNIGEPD